MFTNDTRSALSGPANTGEESECRLTKVDDRALVLTGRPLFPRQLIVNNSLRSFNLESNVAFLVRIGDVLQQRPL